MDKIIATGYEASGRTCYLAAMYDTMHRGVNNFSLVEKDKSNELFLHKLWTEISHGATRKWPTFIDGIKSNSFTFFHNSDKIIEFEWLDYPVTFSAYFGGRITDDFKKQFSESACHLIFINGESFAYEWNPTKKKPIRTTDIREYKEIVARNFMKNKDFEALRQLGQICNDCNDVMPPVLPPIGIIITKSDLIDDMWIPYISEIIEENFRPIFGENEPYERIVMITAVTLGKDIESGADARPEYIEQPIAFAILQILRKQILAARFLKANCKGELIEKEKSFRKVIISDQLEQLRKQIAQTDEFINKASKAAVYLLNLFSDKKPIYVNGSKRNFRNYFRNWLKPM